VADPLLLRAAVVATALVGAWDDTFSAFTPSDRERAIRLRARLRAAGDRRQIAEAIVAERMALMRAREASASSVTGARLYARWLRDVDAATRTRVVRALDEASVVAITAQTGSQTSLSKAERSRVAWMIAIGVRALGHMPSTVELSLFLDALCRSSDVTSPGLVRWERALRVASQREACEALARAWVDDP
jgi:hypothetical protein